MSNQQSPEALDALTVHVINLDRSNDRLATFTDMNAHLGTFTRVPAVDGAALDLDQARRIIDPELFDQHYYSRGAVGAAMSHVGMWKLAAEKNIPVTVAEDDAVFSREFATRAHEILSGLPADFDFILWGFNFDMFLSFEFIPGVSTCLAQFDQAMLRTRIARFPYMRTGRSSSYPLLCAFGILCYTISPKGAREFMSRLLPLQPKVLSFPDAIRAEPRTQHFRTAGIDNHLNEIYRDTKSFVCFPPLVVTSNERETSTVQA
jgi:glycosyl transferase, family 25